MPPFSPLGAIEVPFKKTKNVLTKLFTPRVMVNGLFDKLTAPKLEPKLQFKLFRNKTNVQKL